MTPNLTRIAPDGTTEYWCSTTKRYYRPEVVTPPADGFVWTFCTLCDTEGRALLWGRDAQAHCYPVGEEAHAHPH